MKKSIFTLLFAVVTMLFAGCASTGSGTKVVMETTAGTMEFVLYDETPKHRDNFIKLAQEQYFDSLLFHRVIKDFMIQGGDPKGDGTGGSGKPVVGEFSANGYNNDISHKRGVISMARSGGDATNNYGYDSGSSQFFICNDDSSDSLDGKYAAFGYVVEGMSVIDEITEEVFPKTAYADYYGDYSIDPYYGTYRHTVWNYLGNGAVAKAKDKPVIKYIKVLDSWEMSDK